MLPVCGAIQVVMCVSVRRLVLPVMTVWHGVSCPLMMSQGDIVNTNAAAEVFNLWLSLMHCFLFFFLVQSLCFGTGFQPRYKT